MMKKGSSEVETVENEGCKRKENRIDMNVELYREL
jgi:hypothetical protein